MLNLPSLLEAMFKNESLKDESRDIIENIFSKENIKNEELLDHLLSLLKAMVKNKSLKNEAKYIIKNLFSEENIGTVLKSEIFMGNLPSLLEDMIENKSFENDVKYIIKNMFLSNMSSNKNLGEVLRSVDLSLGRLESATGNIIKGLAKEMLEKEYKDFEKKEPNNIVKNLISSKNIMPELSSSSMQKGISSFRNKTEDSASDFIRNILGNNSVPEELKSELKALLDDFSAKRRKFIPQELIKEGGKTRNRELAVSQREG